MKNTNTSNAQHTLILEPESSNFRPSLVRRASSWTLPTKLSRQGTRSSSIVSFARSLKKHVCDANNSFSPEPTALDNDQTSHDSRDGSPKIPSQDSKTGRKFSSILSSTLKRKSSIRQTNGQTDMEQSITVSQEEDSLRTRRKIDFDLPLPLQAPSPLTPSPRFQNNLSDFAQPSPRSPKPWWSRSETPNLQPKWTPTTATIEEDYIGLGTVRKRKGECGLLPGNDTIDSSGNPKVERPKLNVRNRYLAHRGRRSRSGTSETVPTQKSDGSWASDEPKGLSEQQVRTKAKLQQPGHISRRTRSDRRRWARSSDDASLGPIDESTGRRSSINPFKRSDRIADKINGDTERKQAWSPSRLWWIGKQPTAQAQTEAVKTLVDVPRPRHLLPISIDQIPTPPLFDVNGEVKGRLADFYFDHGTGTMRMMGETKPGGYWDSDVLLMSYMSADKEAEEDSAVDPLSAHSASPPVLHRNTSYQIAGLVTAPDGDRDTRDTGTGQQHRGCRTKIPEEGTPWFRVQYLKSPPRGQLTAMEFNEMVARRKFEWVVPEHLPSSPLCPLHPKYQGYAFKMCYWHETKTHGGIRNRRDGGEE
ncbi:hypothetical protein GQ44DRAFT_701507 [Phaeosphaeriaceae sp. PMI808]|nr:hypothetical protein GQ44DRAFT_701507 [Phaeosphaeriaceae sp. PMI808]